MASSSRLIKSVEGGKPARSTQINATSFKNKNKSIFEIDHQRGIGKAKSKVLQSRFDPLARKVFENDKDKSFQIDCLEKSKLYKTNSKEKTRGDINASSRKYSSVSKKKKDSLDDVTIKDSDESSMVIDTDDVVAGVQNYRLQIEEANQQVVDQNLEIKEISNVEPMDIICDAVNKLFIVLDTNVLLGDLMIVNSAKKISKRVTFIVPWVVLQELDLIKSDNYKKVNLKPLAIKAIDYVYCRFKEHDPHFRGQRAVESSSVKFKPESNDDKILHCCLQCKGKSEGETILFSNDKNLANKALVHNIKVCTKDDIVSFVEKLMVVPENSQEINRRQQKEIIEKIYKDWYNVVELILEEMLTTEMKNIYEDQWLSVILIKPPWNLKEALTCIRKHWFAVFGYFMSKNADNIVKKLLELVRRPLPDYKEVEDVINLSENFFSSFKKPRSYDAQLKTAKSRLKNFKAQLKSTRKLRCDTVNEINSLNSLELHPNANPQPTSVTKTYSSKNRSDASCLQSDLVIVRETFDIVWNFINRSSGLILDCFMVNNPLSYSRPTCLPSVRDAENFLKIFYPTLINLKSLLQTIVTSNSRPTNSTDIVYDDLCYLILNFSNILGIQDDNLKLKNLTPQMFYKFSHHHQTRELMERGLNQLEYFISLIEQLK